EDVAEDPELERAVGLGQVLSVERRDPQLRPATRDPRRLGADLVADVRGAEAAARQLGEQGAVAAADLAHRGGRAGMQRDDVVRLAASAESAPAGPFLPLLAAVGVGLVVEAREVGHRLGEPTPITSRTSAMVPAAITRAFSAP